MRYLRRDEASAETAREKALWDVLEIFFATPSNPQGTAAEVGAARCGASIPCES